MNPVEVLVYVWFFLWQI